LEADAEGLRDYEHSVEAYRSAQFEEAAELLRAFAVAHPSSSLLDDASFLEASSLASAGRSDAAALLAERHLLRFPSSFHRKEAAILVARLRRDRGDCDGARNVAAAWLSESRQDPRVRAALGGCAGD
jgi:TolA-binding protein